MKSTFNFNNLMTCYFRVLATVPAEMLWLWWLSSLTQRHIVCEKRKKACHQAVSLIWLATEMRRCLRQAGSFSNSAAAQTTTSFNHTQHRVYRHLHLLCVFFKPHRPCPDSSCTVILTVFSHPYCGEDALCSISIVQYIGLITISIMYCICSH